MWFSWMVSFAKTPSASAPVEIRSRRTARSGVLEMTLVIVRALALACRGHQELVLENMALRQQLRAFKRATKRPRLRTRDRLFWIVLANTWQPWRTALLIVQPDTVLRWHHRLASPSTDPPVDAHPRRSLSNRSRDPRACPRDGGGQPVMGRAFMANSPNSGQRVGANGVEVASTTTSSTVTNVADVPHQSSGRPGVHGFLHGADGDGSRLVRPGLAGTRAPAHRLLQRCRASDGTLSRPASR
jgi:hypothetical protein